MRNAHATAFPLAGGDNLGDVPDEIQKRKGANATCPVWSAAASHVGTGAKGKRSDQYDHDLKVFTGPNEKDENQMTLKHLLFDLPGLETLLKMVLCKLNTLTLH